MIVKCVLCENPLCLALIGITQDQLQFVLGRSSHRHLNLLCPFCGMRFALTEQIIVERQVMPKFSVRFAVALNSASQANS